MWWPYVGVLTLSNDGGDDDVKIVLPSLQTEDDLILQRSNQIQVSKLGLSFFLIFRILKDISLRLKLYLRNCRALWQYREKRSGGTSGCTYIYSFQDWGQRWWNHDSCRRCSRATAEIFEGAVKQSMVNCKSILGFGFFHARVYLVLCINFIWPFFTVEMLYRRVLHKTRVTRQRVRTYSEPVTLTVWT